jgi:hypothetical protein
MNKLQAPSASACCRITDSRSASSRCLRSRFVYFFMLISICIGTLHAQTTPVVWTASSLARIWQNTAAGSSRQIDIYAARDQTYSFQIGVQAVSGKNTNVRATTSGLAGPSGTINGSDIVFYREQFFPVPAIPSWMAAGPNAPGGAGMYPDGLIPFVDDETGRPASGGSISAQPFTVTAGTNQVLWIDVHAPATYSAGTYTGTVAISSDQGTSSVTVRLHIWNFELPKIPSYKSSLQASQTGNRNDRLARELLRNRQSPAWSISSSYLESQYVDQYGLNSANMFKGTGWNKSNCVNDTTPPMSEPSSSVFHTAYAAHDPRLVIINFLADEVYPDHRCTTTYPAINKWANDMHTAAANSKAFVSISPQSDPGDSIQVSSLYGHVDIWAALPSRYQAYPADNRARIAAGDQVWLYNVLVQDTYSPKQNLNWGSLDWRLALGYISANLGLSGWQQWSIDCWGSSPWTNGAPGGCSNSSVPGDGFSVYPGGPVGITGYAPSMRIKWSRDGINDYEYVHMLKGLGQSSWVTAQINPIAHDFANWTRDYNQVEAVRIALGNKIEQLMGGAPAATLKPPVITSALATQATASGSFSYQIAATNNPTSFNATGLPAGLSVNKTTGIISGAPSVAGISNIPISATNSAGSGGATLVLSVAQKSTGGTSSSIALRQTNAAEGSGVSSVSTNFPASNITGNLVIAFVRMSTTTQTVRVTDTAGNVYTDAVSQVQSADGHQIHIFYAKNVRGAANTVTATFSSGNAHPWLAVYEYSGLNTTSPLDKKAGAQGSGATPSATVASTTAPNELLFVGSGLPAAFAGSLSAGAGFALLRQDTGSSRGANESGVVATPGSYSAKVNLSGNANWTAAIATFKP